MSLLVLRWSEAAPAITLRWAFPTGETQFANPAESSTPIAAVVGPRGRPGTKIPVLTENPENPEVNEVWILAP